MLVSLPVRLIVVLVLLIGLVNLTRTIYLLPQFDPFLLLKFLGLNGCRLRLMDSNLNPL